MELFSEPEIEKWQQTISREYCKAHQANAWLFNDREEYFHFIFGCVGLGIARAIADRKNYNKEVGSFYWFCCLKSFEVLRDEMRKEHRRRKASSQAVLTDLYLLHPRVISELEASDDLRRQNEYLQELSADQRDVLLLVDYLGCPAKEAGLILKRKTGAIYSLLKRARRRAADVYTEQEQKQKPPIRDAPKPSSSRGPRRPRDDLSDDSRAG